MKRFFLATLLAAALLSAPAQAGVIRSDDPQIVNKGPHERTWQTVSLDRDENGIETLRTNAFVEVASGLNRWDDQRNDWVEASDEIEIINGAGVARKAQHKVIFAANVNDVKGSIDLSMPDGNRLVIQCIGLAYTESDTGKSVFIAETKNSIGQLTGRNTIVYPDAFDFVKADIVAQMRKDAFEHDVVLKEKIPGPETFGLNPLTAKLEVWHQILSSPRAKTEPGTIKRKNGHHDADDKVDFGSMRLGEGAAFPLADQRVNLGGGNGEGDKVRVAREWVDVDGFDFLIESVPYQESKPQIDDLPVQAEARQINREKIDKAFAQVQKGRRAKPVSVAKLMDWKREEKPKAFASIERGEARNDRGYVLDYVTVSAGLSSYVWKGDTTYYVSGAVSCTGTTTFEGGCVVKFAPAASNKITIGGPLKWEAGYYRPVVLTARDNHAIGDAVGTSALVSTPYADTALEIIGSASGPVSIDHVRITHAANAIVITGSAGHQINNAQILSCNVGLKADGTDVTLRNALMANVLTSLISANSASAKVEHLTVSVANVFNNGFAAANLLVANSLLVAVTTPGPFTGTAVSSAGSTSVFATKGVGNYYLADNTYRNVGTTNLSPTTLGILKRTTTFAPTELTSHFTTPTTLYPYVERDVVMPDLGYHYDPIDYFWSGLNVTGTTLTLTNGVAVAAYGLRGTILGSGGNFTSEGTPAALNRLTRYNTVQEQPVLLGTNGPNMSLIFMSSTPTVRPDIQMRFTEATFLADAGGRRYVFDPISAGGSNLIHKLVLRDCQIRGGRFVLMPGPDSAGLTASLTNNLFERGAFLLQRYADSPTVGYLRNNLFRNSSVEMTYTTYTVNPTWEIKDNLFDTCTLYGGGANVANDHNAYRSCGPWSNSAGFNTTLASDPDYATGSLGKFYYPTTGGILSALVNAGSRNADAATLFHHTTRVDNTKESGAVDIGFHYAAVDANGQPLDSDADGIPDYLEDANGNGAKDGAETGWQNEYNSANGLVGTPAIQILTPLKP